jgi:hypothetical protein
MGNKKKQVFIVKNDTNSEKRMKNIDTEVLVKQIPRNYDPDQGVEHLDITNLITVISFC